MKRFFLLISDVAMLFGALVLMMVLRYWGSGFAYEFSLHVVPFSILFVVWILAFYITSLYDPRKLRNTPEFYSQMLNAGILAGIASIAFFYLLPIYGITPRINLFIFLVIFGILQTASRWIWNHLFAIGFKRPIIFVGLDSQTMELADYITANPQLGLRVRYLVAIGSDTVNSYDKNFSVIYGLDQLKQIIATEPIDTVIVSPEAYQMPDLIDIFYRALDWHITFRNLASFYEEVTGRVPLGAINQVWFLENLTESSKRAYEMLKRASDIALGTVFSLLTALMFPFISLAIKLDSAGPVLYRQKRLGRAGKVFDIIKFRTMYRHAEKNGAVWAQDNDSRVTRVGKFLRRTRIDELPQLWNILMGDMSFVGPRAERPEFHGELKTAVPFYEERYLIKPGLSGWAQINYRYGSSIKDAAEKLQYDLYYIKNRSLMLDIGILLKTINISLKQAGR